MHRTGIAATVHISQLAYTHGTPWGSVKALYEHSVFSTKMNYTNSLLQDISIFTGHDTTLLEDRLVDIETAADLTSETEQNLLKPSQKV